MARRNAKTRDTGREDADTPDRPDQIARRPDDPDDRLVSITDDDKGGEHDVNEPLRTDDARSDAEKDAERLKAEDDRRLTGDDDDGEERRPRRGWGGRDPDGMSESMRRRIGRERALRERSDERVTNLTRDLQRTKQRLAQFERAGSGTDKQELSIKEIDTKLTALKTKLEEAIENGKSAEQAQIQMEISDLQAEKKLLQRDIESIKARKPEDTGGTDDGGADDGKPVTPLVDDFIKANRRWWNLPSAKALKDAAVAIDLQIKAEIKDGDADFEEYSEEHMDELASRLLEEAESLKKQGTISESIEIRDFNGDTFEPEEDDGREAPAKGRAKENGVRSRNGGGGRSPQGGMGGRDGRRGQTTELELARQGRARLTEQDYAQMRVFGLNPHDKDHVKRFAKERVRSIITDANKGGRR